MKKVYHGFAVDKGIDPSVLMEARKHEVLQAFLWAWASGYEVYTEKAPDGWHALSYIGRIGIPESLTVEKTLAGAVNESVKKAYLSM